MMRQARTVATRGIPSQADLERVFFLDDADRKLVDLRRGEHMKAGFALQLVTMRWLRTFLEDPLDVPGAVLDFVAGAAGDLGPVAGAGPRRWPAALRHRRREQVPAAPGPRSSRQ